MTGLIAWCGFFGAWLLVAGPIFQAAVELHDEDVARDEFEAASKAVVPRYPPASPWWWLLPPVAYYLWRKRSDRFRRAVMTQLGPEVLEQFISFINKATGWLYVAAGASLIAVKETWELAEHEEWHHWVFWVLIVFMALVAVGNAAFRMFRAQRVLEKHARLRAGAESAPPPPAITG